MADEQKNNDEGEKKSPLSLTAKEAGGGALVGAIATNALVWSPLKTHLQNYWNSAYDYFVPLWTQRMGQSFAYEQAGDLTMAQIEGINADTFRAKSLNALEKLNALKHAPSTPAHYAIIAGSFVAFAALTVGVMRWFEHQNQEQPYDSPSTQIDTNVRSMNLPHHSTQC
ncbi:MAG: hypothetical protein EAZ74_04155 [Alphaproteobacteria bacterium]|nr:MAG: hypothetical protein EAY76_02665 [Alphaproteobacteria bacterium]TAF14379.1 MAG: hypothetical protein EAZ74_04155 [Alphaproteobacteria bacterium]TAF41469.1 MAG: hypothetical protein EAZ66_01290 [Alphaproteobacteria bacterium]TAF75719.1 MAG: hypothetical protein EAZ52_06015 [Alphaproteobacteria bacterium]